jgi:hypothetical protein
VATCQNWVRRSDLCKTYVVGLLLALLGTTTEAEHQVEGGLLLDVVVAESTSVLELFASEDQTLLVGGNARWQISALAILKIWQLLTLPCLGS